MDIRDRVLSKTFNVEEGNSAVNLTKLTLRYALKVE